MFLYSEHAGQRSDWRDLHRGPAGLVQRRGQELVRRHERQAGLREGLRRPHRALQAGGQKATQWTKVGGRMGGWTDKGKMCCIWICFMTLELQGPYSIVRIGS